MLFTDLDKTTATVAYIILLLDDFYSFITRQWIKLNSNMFNCSVIGFTSQYQRGTSNKIKFIFIYFIYLQVSYFTLLTVIGDTANKDNCSIRSGEWGWSIRFRESDSNRAKNIQSMFKLNLYDIECRCRNELNKFHLRN